MTEKTSKFWICSHVTFLLEKPCHSIVWELDECFVWKSVSIQEWNVTFLLEDKSVEQLGCVFFFLFFFYTVVTALKFLDLVSWFLTCASSWIFAGQPLFPASLKAQPVTSRYWITGVISMLRTGNLWATETCVDLYNSSLLLHIIHSPCGLALVVVD